MEILDEAAFNELRDLMRDKFPRMLQLYIETTSGYRGEMGTALKTGDWKTVREKAHTIKSSSRQLGLMELASVAERIEKAALSEDEKKAVTLTHLVDQFDESFSRARLLLESA